MLLTSFANPLFFLALVTLPFDSSDNRGLEVIVTFSSCGLVSISMFCGAISVDCLSSLLNESLAIPSEVGLCGGASAARCVSGKKCSNVARGFEFLCGL